MNPRQSGRGRPEPDLDPHKGPLVALAWALFVLRPPRGHSGHKTLEEIARAIRYHKSMVSKLTSGKSLPSLGPMTAYLKFYGVGNTEPWERLRGLAQEAVIEADKLQEFAEAFMDLCAKSLAEQYRQRVGTVEDLVASWSGHEADEDESAQAQDDHFAPMPPTEDVAGQDGGTPGPLGASPAGGGGRASNARRLTWMVATVVVLVLVVAATVPKPWEDDSGGTASSHLPACEQADMVLRIISSPEKVKILKDLAQAYGPHSIDDKCVKVEVFGIDSGSAMRALARGWNTVTDGPLPDVWAPASQVWLKTALMQAKGNNAALGRLPKTVDNSSIATSPLVIAMPRPIAEQQGWPTEKLSWKGLAELAKRPGFKLGKTNPETSTSGLNAIVAESYALLGITGELGREDLDGLTYRKEVRDIEKAAVHYGDTTLTFLANLRRADDAGRATSYISAVVVEESSVVAYNRGYPCGSQSDEPGCGKKTPPDTKLLAFYPTDKSGVGTIYSDHPYIPLNGLPGAKEKVAADFQRFLTTSKLAQDRFAEMGFRPPTHKLPASITQTDGVPLTSLPKPLDVPSADVLDRLLVVWRELRKPANVLVLIDTSESMRWNAEEEAVEGPGGPSKLDLVKKANAPLLGRFTDRDRVGLWPFSSECPRPGPGRLDDPKRLAEMASKTSDGKTHRELLKTEFAKLSPGARTALYRCIRDAVQYMRDNYAKNAINAIVVLSDGENNPGNKDPGPSIEELLADIGTPSRKPVRVFTIAYGSKAEKPMLRRIAEVTNARAYDASDPNSIADVLTNVISNF